MIPTPNSQFFNYVAKYLGVAMISGSIVHMGTLDSGAVRYFVLLVIGLFLMLFGNIQEARTSGRIISTSYIGVIVALSFATGIISGGVQHYLDNPSYAGSLLGVGAFATYLTFFWKEKFEIKPRDLIVVAVCSVSIIVFSVFFVDQLVSYFSLGHVGHVH